MVDAAASPSDPAPPDDAAHLRAAIEAHRRAEYHKRWPDDTVPTSVNGDDPYTDLGDEHDRVLWRRGAAAVPPTDGERQ